MPLPRVKYFIFFKHLFPLLYIIIHKNKTKKNGFVIICPRVIEDSSCHWYYILYLYSKHRNSILCELFQVCQIRLTFGCSPTVVCTLGTYTKNCVRFMKHKQKLFYVKTFYGLALCCCYCYILPGNKIYKCWDQ